MEGDLIHARYQVNIATASVDEQYVELLDSHIRDSGRLRNVHLYYDDKAECWGRRNRRLCYLCPAINLLGWLRSNCLLTGDIHEWVNAPKFGGRSGMEKIVDRR